MGGHIRIIQCSNLLFQVLQSITKSQLMSDSMIHRPTEAQVSSQALVDIQSIKDRVPWLARTRPFLQIGFNILNCSLDILWGFKCSASGSILKFNFTKLATQVLRGLANQLFFQLKKWQIVSSRIDSALSLLTRNCQHIKEHPHSFRNPHHSFTLPLESKYQGQQVTIQNSCV